MAADRPARIALSAACLGLVARLLHFVAVESVDLLHWDQWDLLDGWFRGATWNALFFQQHGPHRQGLGGWLMAFVFAESGGDARAIAMAVGLTLVAAATVALMVQARLGGRLDLLDLAVFAPFVSLGDWGALVGAPNPAYAALPLLFLLLASLALTVVARRSRCLALVALNVALVYTGFGLLAAPLLFVVLAREWLRARRATPHESSAFALATVASATVAASFFVGYVPNPALACFTFPDPTPRHYLYFMAAQIAAPLGLLTTVKPGLVVGGLVLVGYLWLAGRALYQAGSQDPRPRQRAQVVFLLVGFSLLFSASSAVGRVCSGVDGALQSRYVPFLVPAVVALALHLKGLAPGHLRTAARSVLFALVLINEIALVPPRLEPVKAELITRRTWASCYVVIDDIAECDRATGYQIYPKAEGTDLGWKLSELRARGLGPFRAR